ncbi:recombinase family protein [Deinococcus apachensis]|uniref:recombinase family protein n=1 Tax=Deinococcus apachensis TaxID=309886 RepID=UPI0003762852
MSRAQRVGYVRVSSAGQNTARQLDGVPVDRVFEDHASGKGAARPALGELRRYVREGDVVVVHSMDRLARDLDDLRALVDEFTGRGVQVEFVREGLLFSGDDTPMARRLLSVMGAVVEFERTLIRER